MGSDGDTKSEVYAMIKREELTNPNSCMSKAKDNEMTFVLLSRDIAAPQTIRFWVSERIKYEKNKSDDAQIIEALKCAEEMEKQLGVYHLT